MDHTKHVATKFDMLTHAEDTRVVALKSGRKGTVLRRKPYGFAPIIKWDDGEISLAGDDTLYLDDSDGGQ